MVLLFVYCNKKSTPKIAKLETAMDPAILPIFQAYQLQDFQVGVIWDQPDLDAQEHGIINFPLVGDKNTVLGFSDGRFYYKRVLKSTKPLERISLYFGADGFLEMAFHQMPGKPIKMDTYLVNSNQKSNFLHLNSNSRKYQSFEDFDFEDLIFYDPTKPLLLEPKGNEMACYQYSHTVSSLSVALAQELENAASVDAADYYTRYCSFYTDVVNKASYLCNGTSLQFLVGLYSNKKEIWCTPKFQQVPCPGDILADMQIAPTENGGKKAGLYGEKNRMKKQLDGTTKPGGHYGMDIAAEVGTSFSSPYDGTVDFAGHKVETNPEKGAIDPVDGIHKGDFGNFVQVIHEINGKKVLMTYAHMQSFDVKRGQKITQGQSLGKSGKTGNAQGTGIKPHVHIEAQERVGDKWGERIDPASFINTKFDANGNKDPNTKKCYIQIN